MNILLVAATKQELWPFINKFNNQIKGGIFPNRLYHGKIRIDVLVAGIGLVSTSYYLSKTLGEKKYDMVINAGIAGSFMRDLEIGEVVWVVEEELGDLGIEDEQGFHTLFEMDFLPYDTFPFQKGKLVCNSQQMYKLLNIKRVNALTSNTAHGRQEQIDNILCKFKPQIETMEGACIFYICLMEKVNFIQIRAISNYVESRDRSKWNIPLAIENLSVTLVQLINELDNSME
jgi:futalosine hydrolase